MTRHKNDIANGVRLENASWRTWWQKRGKLKTVNPQKLNWSAVVLSSVYYEIQSFYRLKDSDVTWLYGPLHQAPTPVPVPPPKGASLREKLEVIPPLPKGRKPILKKRTLAEVLVLGLAKTNNLPSRPHADELKELDIDSRGTRGPEERDRIMLLHTKSDTNLLRPAVGRVTQPSPPSDDDTPTPRHPVRRTNRSALSMKGSVSPPPHDLEGGVKKRVGFNAYVSQCIAVTPGEQSSSDDEVEVSSDALSIKPGGSISGRQSTSRSNSHSSSRSDHLIIAPMAPTLLKETRSEEEQLEGPALVYMPIDTPFDPKDSDDESDFGATIEVNSPPERLPPPDDSEGGLADLGGEYGINNKKRKLSAGEIPPPRRQYRGSEGESKAEGTLASPSNGHGPVSSTTSNVANTIPVASTAIALNGDSRGRTLHRVSSSSSLDEGSRSRNGSSPLGSGSPESSRASSASTRGSSTDMGFSGRSGRGVTRADFKSGKSSSSSVAEDTEEPANFAWNEQPAEGPVTCQQNSDESAEAKPTPQQEGSGFVDKAVANARGLIGTLLNGSSSSGNTKNGSLNPFS